jgi:hypothetical protein
VFDILPYVLALPRPRPHFAFATNAAIFKHVKGFPLFLLLATNNIFLIASANSSNQLPDLFRTQVSPGHLNTTPSSFKTSIASYTPAPAAQAPANPPAKHLDPSQPQLHKQSAASPSPLPFVVQDHYSFSYSFSRSI